MKNVKYILKIGSDIMYLCTKFEIQIQIVQRETKKKASCISG
jgi:hypothetical protein